MDKCMFSSAFEERKSVQRHPYNFIFAAQKKLKAGKVSNKNENLKLKHTTEYKNNKYCIQTTTFQLQASRPILGSQGSSTYISIKLNMQFIILIPKFELLMQNKETKFPHLGNALKALRDRLNKGDDIFRSSVKNSTKCKLTEDIEKMRIGYLRKEIFVADKTNSKSLINLLRLREKILIDRTITLLSWFEVQIEKLKSENSFLNISEIRKKQEKLLLNLHTERKYINRLLQLYKNKKVILSIRKPSELKISDETICLRRYNDARKKLKIKFISTKDCWKYKELYNALWTNILDKTIEDIGNFNLSLWILNRTIHKDSILLKLLPQNYNAFNMIRRHWKSLYDNAKELEIQKKNCEFLNSSRININNPRNALQSYKNDNEFILLSQDIKTQDTKNQGTETQDKLDIDSKKRSIIDRIKEDVTLELIEEHKKSLGQYDSSNTMESLSWLRYRQKNVFNDIPNFFLKRSQSSFKWDHGCKCDDIEKIIIYQLYNEDVQWENMYAIQGDILEALVDKLIIQHIEHIAKCVISE